MLRASLGIILIGALSACGGGAGSPLPAHSNAPTSSAFVIRIPAKKNSMKQPKYVSPSTASIAIAISPGSSCSACTAATTLDANLTPGSAQCPTTGGVTTCTINVSLNPGSYVASISTYDALSETGNVLSSNPNVPFSIVANQTNSIAIALSEVVASYKLTLSGTPPATLQSGQLTVDGVGTTVTLNASAYDADNNLILGTTPSIANVSVGGAGFVVGSPSGAGFAVTTPAKGTRAPANVTVTFGGSGCPAAPLCTVQLTASMTEFVAVADVAAVIGGGHQGHVFVYNERTGAVAITATDIASIPNFGFVTFDPTGNLWVASYGGLPPLVYEYAPPYTGTFTTPLPSDPGFSADAIAFDANGNAFLYGTSAAGPPQVLKYSYPSYAAPATISAGGVQPAGLLVDTAGDLWTADARAPAQFVKAPISAANVTALTSTHCWSLAQDLVGNVDLSCDDGGAGSIDRYNTAGASVSSTAVGVPYYGMAATKGGLFVINGGLETYAFGASSASAVATVPGAEGIATDRTGALLFDVGDLADPSTGGLYALPSPYTGVPQLLEPLQVTAVGVSNVSVWP